MKIATHNSEKLLLADLREARIGNPKHRCLLLRLSQAEEDIAEWLPLLDKAVRHTMHDVIDQMYLTHDQDIFIYGWGLTQSLAQDLVFELSQKLSANTLQNLIQLYEIGVHWDQLESLCVAKIRALEEINKKREKPVKQDNQITRDEVFAELSEELLTTIPQRRKARKDIEILIVEDDMFSQTLIKKALGDQYSLNMADDGQGAILSYVKTAPDICFLDIELPDINGHEVLEKIKSIDENAYIVMFSGNGDRENILKALDLGAQGFVGKPFAKEKLFQYIDKSPFILSKKSNTPSTTQEKTS